MGKAIAEALPFEATTERITKTKKPEKFPELRLFA